MIWIFLIFLPFLLIIYLFIYKFINHRKFSKKNGIELIIRIIKANKLPMVFILDLNNPNSNTINFIKYQLKAKNINYLTINNHETFKSLYQIYNNLFEKKFIIFVNSIHLSTHSNYFKKYSQNILILNIYYNNSINFFEFKINTIKSLIKELRSKIEYLDSDIKTLSISDKIIFSELEYAYDIQLVDKKSINNLKDNDYEKIIIPNEYFLFKKDIPSYLSKKSMFKDVYLEKDNTFINKINKVRKINYVFNGINDSYDFNPKFPTNFNFTRNQQLFNFINYSDNLIIFVDDKIILNRDCSLILHDLKKIFGFTIIIDSIHNLKISENINYIIICHRNNKIVGGRNILVYNLFNFKSLLTYIFSKIFELRINYINDKKLFFNKNGDDLLLISKYQKDELSNKLKDELIWIQYIDHINIIEYLKIISLQKKTFIHILLNNYPSDQLITLLNKLELKYIIYLKNRIPNLTPINSLTLDIQQININNLKPVVYQSNKGLIIYYF